MRAQTQIITYLLLSGLLITIVGVVYLWGIPLIQKNRDINLLQGSEDFMKRLDLIVKDVANTHGRNAISFELDGELWFNESENAFRLIVETKGSIYSVGRIYFVRNPNETGEWGKDEPAILYVDVSPTASGYRQVYVLKYRKLLAKDGRSFQIALQGGDFAVHRGRKVVVEFDQVLKANGETKTIVRVYKE